MKSNIDFGVTVLCFKYLRTFFATTFCKLRNSNKFHHMQRYMLCYSYNYVLRSALQQGS